MDYLFDKKHTNPMVISYLTLRRLIGILGIILPALLVLGTFILGSCHHIQDSISHYYYTIMGDVYVGTLCAVAIFLMTYRGYEKIDDIASTLAGIFALGSALFSTSHNPDVQCTIRTLPDLPWRITVHYLSSAFFLLTLSFISIFLFTKSTGLKSIRKKIRNSIYITCGIIMFVAILLIFLVKAVPWLKNNLAPLHPVFWLEWLALLAFGTSWLIKGEALLADKK